MSTWHIVDAPKTGVSGIVSDTGYSPGGREHRKSVRETSGRIESCHLSPIRRALREDPSERKCVHVGAESVDARAWSNCWSPFPKCLATASTPDHVVSRMPGYCLAEC
eukprot:2562517-Rhodomonas_salina.2